MELVRTLAYNLVLLIPALLIAPGCGGDPPAPPAGAPVEDVDEFKSQVEGIEMGTEVTSPPDKESNGGEPDSSKGAETPSEE